MSIVSPRTYAHLMFWPTLVWNVLLGRVLKVRHWWDRVDETVVLGALPFKSDVPQLRAAGIRGVVNTCEEYAGPVAEYQAAGIEQLRIPTTDFQPPELADVQQAVEFIAQYAARGESVYVHCKAGRARSATVVACWLMTKYQVTPAEAQRWMLEKRPHVNPRIDQRAVVRQFYDALSRSSSR